jgi:hypothetical protein
MALKWHSNGSQLDVLELQPPGKKTMDAKSFW